MKTIAIDIDDVLAAHIPEVVKFSNDRYGTDLTVDTYKERWSIFWGVDYEEMMRRAEAFHRQTVTNYKRIEGADEVLERLGKKYRLEIVTARPKYNIPATYAWLDEHFGGVFSDVHYVPIWEKNNQVTKADICRQIGAEYLIDDIPRHCNMAAQAGITALLFGGYNWCADQPLHKDVIKVRSWHKVGDYFDV